MRKFAKGRGLLLLLLLLTQPKPKMRRQAALHGGSKHHLCAMIRSKWTQARSLATSGTLPRP